MTGLLISVRNKDEAETVLSACPGLDILDIKEPSAGALGAATPQTWQEIASLTLHDTSLSIALGDLNDVPVNELDNLPLNARYAKVGLANQQHVDEHADKSPKKQRMSRKQITNKTKNE